MSQGKPNPSHIMEVGVGFWASKTLLSAVELQLFSHLGAESMTGEEIGERLGLHPRAIYDFLDALVALRLLERDGDGSDGRYRNTADTAAFLDKRSSVYIGGILEMANARLYRFWADLTEALQAGNRKMKSSIPVSRCLPSCIATPQDSSSSCMQWKELPEPISGVGR
jgi:hypothetical protein